MNTNSNQIYQYHHQYIQNHPKQRLIFNTHQFNNCINFLASVFINPLSSIVYYFIVIFHMQDLTCVFQALDGKGAIFISALTTARNLTLLKKNNIKAVLSIARGASVQFGKDDIPFYLYLPADDNETYDLSKHFDSTYKFIEMARKETNVLIHCVAGISRSVTITAAYLLKKFEYSLHKVMLLLKRKRNIVDPNPGFIEQLIAFEQHIKSLKRERQTLMVQKLNSKQEQAQKKQKQGSPSPKKQTHQTPITKNSSLVESNPQPINPQKTNRYINKSPSRNATCETKDKISLGTRIDRVKKNLVGKRKMSNNDSYYNKDESLSKVYSPLLYRNRTKIVIFKQ